MDEDEQDESLYEAYFLTYPLLPTPPFYRALASSDPPPPRWPQALLSQLPTLFSQLETFVEDQRNWNARGCSQQEVEEVERQLGHFLAMLTYEKIYGERHWKEPRRCQASVLHYYAFLKALVADVIPKGCSSLMNAYSQGKLMLDLLKLQELVNAMLPLLKHVHTFLIGPFFQEELALTQAFFEELLLLVKNLPRVRKESLHHAPQLLEFTHIALAINKAEERKQEKDHQIIKPVGSRRKQRSRQSSISDALEDNPRKYFRFDDRIRRSTASRKHKLTVTSAESKEKSDSLDHTRSPSFFDRSLTLFDSERLKRSTMIESPSKQGSPSYNRSRLFTSKTNFSKPISRQKSRKKSPAAQEIEQQRQDKNKRKKVVQKVQVRVNPYSNLFLPQNGTCRGWGVIRAYVQKRIAQKKIRSLLSLL